MNIIRKLLAGAAILGMALAGAAAVTGTASASTVPVVYGSAAALPWHGYVTPGSFYFGQGGAPYFTSLHWTSWNGTSAQATGKLWGQKPGCSPSYLCAYSSRYVQVTLTTVHLRNGIRYYAHMAVRFYYGGKWHVVTGWLGSRGYWMFPLVYPYL